MGVTIVALHSLTNIYGGAIELACVYTGRRQTRRCGSLVLVTARLPEDELYHQLTTAGGLRSVARIGDCLAPGTIAAAIYSGHRYARELDEPVSDGVPFRRELPQLADR